MTNKSGIYRITNMVNSHIYIGQTKNLKGRSVQHFRLLRNGKHHSAYLQNAFDKYGEVSFTYEKLLICEQSELTHYEQCFVDLLNPEYNICKECVTSVAGIKRSTEHIEALRQSRIGSKATEETKRRLSESHKDQKISKENLQKLIDANTGKHRTNETKQRISESHLGEKHWNFGGHLSDECKRKLSIRFSGENNPMYGKPITDEHRQHLIDSHTGIPCSEKHKESMRGKTPWNKGVPITEEARQKQKATLAKKRLTYCNTCSNIDIEVSLSEK